MASSDQFVFRPEICSGNIPHHHWNYRERLSERRARVELDRRVRSLQHPRDHGHQYLCHSHRGDQEGREISSLSHLGLLLHAGLRVAAGHPEVRLARGGGGLGGRADRPLPAGPLCELLRHGEVHLRETQQGKNLDQPSELLISNQFVVSLIN